MNTNKTLSSGSLNQKRGRMTTEHIESRELAKILLKEHPETWQAWVSTDTARRINAAL